MASGEHKVRPYDCDAIHCGHCDVDGTQAVGKEMPGRARVMRIIHTIRWAVIEREQRGLAHQKEHKNDDDQQRYSSVEDRPLDIEQARVATYFTIEAEQR